jgi:hypothetical protein
MGVFSEGTSRISRLYVPSDLFPWHGLIQIIRAFFFILYMPMLICRISSHEQQNTIARKLISSLTQN